MNKFLLNFDMNFIKVFFLVTFSICCTSNVEKLEVYDFDGIEHYLKQNDDKVYVVNFWNPRIHIGVIQNDNFRC